MHYHLILTEKCNLKCKYCYEKSLNEFDNNLKNKFKFDYSDPAVSVVSLTNLKNFLKKDKNPILVFYGGEPLLMIDKIIQIIDFLKDLNVKYRMQTNGIFLDKIPIKYLKKIDKILISLDGGKRITNFYRGKGVYEKVVKNLKFIRKNGYVGELIARMTVSFETPNIYKNVLSLKKLIDKKLINSIHWQLDAGFYSNDYDEIRTTNFFKKYNYWVKKLIFYWFKKIKKRKVYRFYPFLGIVKPILLDDKNCSLRCGSGHSGYTITTSGKIVSCPIMNSIENFKCGDLHSNPLKLKKFDCLAECKNCFVYPLCGGRCLYWRKAKLWPKKGDDLICNSIKFYINEIKKQMPQIQALILNRKINIKKFFYEDYFGPEIIP